MDDMLHDYGTGQLDTLMEVMGSLLIRRSPHHRGLAKRRLPRIWPTFLEQTDIASLRFDFIARRMELARSALISRGDDAVPILDLRVAGAPVANYAVRVKRLLVNGEPVRLDRPLVAVIDTGTTGVSVSDDLFDSNLLPSQWREARVELLPPLVVLNCLGRLSSSGHAADRALLADLELG